MTLLTETCQVISRTAGTVDSYGNESQAASGTITVACNIQQLRRDEPGDEGEMSVTSWAGFFPTGTAIDTSDQVVHATKGTFEVVGDPWDASQGSAAVNHVEASLKRAQ